MTRTLATHLAAFLLGYLAGAFSVYALASLMGGGERYPDA